ncbi:MAG TPA: YbhN family protein [Acidimicrobiales bacterium]|nr:YbhN family protein [Acidimicrobiales bacterium]
MTAEQQLPCAAPDADPGLPRVPSPVADPCTPATGRFRHLLRTVGPLVVGAAVVAVAVTSGAGVGAAVARMRHMDAGLLLAAVVAEAGTFVWLSVHLRLLAGPAANQRRAAPLRTALVVFGLGNVLPAAPAEGVVIAGTALRRRRMQPRRIAVVLGFSQWFWTRGLLAVAAVDAAVAGAVGDLPGPWRGGAIAAAVLTAAALAASTWLSLRRGVAEAVADVALRVRHRRRPLTKGERRRRGAAWHEVAVHVTGTGRQRSALLASTSAAWVCDAGCLLLALRAAGVHVAPDQLLLAYAVGTLASNVPLLPAGMGVVETLTPLVLTWFGAPWGAALTGVLVYRVVGTLLPAAVGLLAAAGLRLPMAGGADDGDTAAVAPVAVLGGAVGAMAVAHRGP